MVNEFQSVGANYIYSCTTQLYVSLKVLSALVDSAYYVTEHILCSLAEFFKFTLVSIFGRYIFKKPCFLYKSDPYVSVETEIKFVRHKDKHQGD